MVNNKKTILFFLFQVENIRNNVIDYYNKSNSYFDFSKMTKLYTNDLVHLP